MNMKKLVLAALTVTLLSTGAAIAGPDNNGKGNGNGNGHSNRDSRGEEDSERVNHGAIASELKWRNAAHASAQAFENASPNSSVGRLATLVSTTNALTAGNLTADGFLDDLDALTDFRPSVVIQAEIDDAPNLDPPLSDEELKTLNTELKAELVLALEAEASVDGYGDALENYNAAAALIAALEDEANDAGLDVGLETLSTLALDALWLLLDGKLENN